MHRIVVIGAGAISPVHIEAFESLGGRAKIVAVAAKHLESAQRVIEKCGIAARAYDDYRLAVEQEDCDAVVICTPPALHCEMAVFCLEHGKHVLVEKPMALCLEECDRMIDAASRSGKKLGVVFQNRFLPPVWKTKKLLDSGEAGALRYAQVNSFWYRGRAYYDLAWRGTWAGEGGGCTFAHAVHHIDLLCWMAGMPSEVTAVIDNVAHDNSEEEDVSMALLRYPGGAVGQLTASLVCHGQEQSLLFACERASLSIPHAVHADEASPVNGFPVRCDETKRMIAKRYDAISPPAFETFAGLADDFLRAIETDSEPVSDGRAGRNALEFIMAVYKSAAEHRTVALPIEKDDPFYTTRGVREQMPHFHEKTGFVDQQGDAPIVLAGTGMS